MLNPHGSQSVKWSSTHGCTSPALYVVVLCSGLLDQASPADVFGAASDIAGSASDLAGSALDVAGSVQGSVGDSLGSIGTFWGSIVESVSFAKDQVTAKATPSQPASSAWYPWYYSLEAAAAAAAAVFERVHVLRISVLFRNTTRHVLRFKWFPPLVARP